MNNRMKMSKVLFTLLVTLLSTTLPVVAQTLDQLRASGAVVERYDGFLQAGSNGSVQAAVNSINNQRRQLYQQRASAQGVSAEQVGRVYAKQIFDSAPAGTRFLLDNGKQVKK